MSQTSLRLTQYRDVIIEAKRRLPNSDVKFNEYANSAMSSIWLAGLKSPLYISEEVDEFDKRIAAEFWNEIRVLTACLEEFGSEIIPLAESHKRDDRTEKFFTLIARQTTALQLWDWYAIPIRYIEAQFVVLRAPDEPQFGVPTITVCDGDFFISQFGAIQARHTELTRKYRRWAAIGTICLLILGWVVFVWISRILSG